MTFGALRRIPVPASALCSAIADRRATPAAGRSNEFSTGGHADETLDPEPWNHSASARRRGRGGGRHRPARNRRHDGRRASGAAGLSEAFPNFAPKLTPQLPGDVDLTLKAKLEKEQKFSQVQREFDLYSWQMFLALNWPTNDQGRAARRITDTKFGAPFWTLWHPSSSIFQTDGSTPKACGDPPAARRIDVDVELAVVVKAGEGIVQHRQRTVLRAAAVMRSMSATLSTGLDGDSNITNRVGLLGQGLLDPRDVLDGQHGVRHAVARQQATDHVARRLIHLGEQEHVIALLAQGQQREIRPPRRPKP